MCTVFIFLVCIYASRDIYAIYYYQASKILCYLKYYIILRSDSMSDILKMQ